MLKKEVIEAVRVARDEQGRPVVPVSQAIRAGDFIFVSGMPPVDPATGNMVQGTIEVQVTQVLENIKMVLEEAGSGMDRVVKTTVWCTNVAWFDRVNAIYRQYFAHEPPTRTFVTVGSWPHEFDIELECIALAGKS